MKKTFRILIFTAIVALAAFYGFKARGELKLIDPAYDFGIIREAEGVKTGMARLVNTGDSATFISEVRPSCGCTGANFFDGEIQPGDTTVITFDYNPAGRPGNFNKTVKVYEGSRRLRHIIKLSGRVVGTPATLSRNYPFECGPLRLSEKDISFSDVKKGAGRHAFVRMVNQSMDTVRPAWNSSDKALSIDLTPTVLAPGEIATLGIYLNSRFEDRSGELEYRCPVYAAGYPDTLNLILRTRVVAEPEQNSEEGNGTDGGATVKNI